MTEGRQENLNPGGEAPKKGQLELNEYKLVTGYVGFFGEGNADGEPIEKEGLVLRKPKWLGTELSKDELGIRVLVAVPVADMPQPEPDLNVGALEREVAELKAQLLMPLTPGDVTLLKAVLSAEKVKLGDGDLCLRGLALVDKLEGFLNPTLPFNKPEETKAEDDGADAEGPSNPEADNDETE